MNSLTRDDYSDKEWKHITDVRKESEWEPPRTELTTAVAKFGFYDSWKLTGTFTLST
jgi:hypothetical protein